MLKQRREYSNDDLIYFVLTTPIRGVINISIENFLIEQRIEP